MVWKEKELGGSGLNLVAQVGIPHPLCHARWRERSNVEARPGSIRAAGALTLCCHGAFYLFSTFIVLDIFRVDAGSNDSYVIFLTASG